MSFENMADNDMQDMKHSHDEGRTSKRETRDGRNLKYEGRGQGERGWGNFPPRRNKDPIKERLAAISGSTVGLETKEGGPKRFAGRRRLFIANLPSSINNDEFVGMFKPYGEIIDIFLNQAKGFGFAKLDTKENAERARAELDYSVKAGRTLRVRFATGAALKIKNLSEWVSNELLEQAFSVFGEIERAVVIVDDRGRSVGEGIIEYVRKQSAQLALERCTEDCFLLTGSPRPVSVELLEYRDEEDGLSEKSLQTSNKEYMKERDIGPRLAERGTFEHNFASRWKQLYEVEKQKREHLEREIMEARHQLEEQVEFSLYEHETNMLREKLCHMEEQNSMLQREREMRLENIRRRDEQRRQDEMMLRQQEEEILRRRGLDDARRWQEDNLMMQASSLSGILDRQEAALRQMQTSGTQNMNERISPKVVDGQAGNGGMPSSMIQGRGTIGIPPQRQFQFDQPPPYMGATGNHSNMVPPVSSSTGNANNQWDQIDEFSSDGTQRRRY